MTAEQPATGLLTVIPNGEGAHAFTRSEVATRLGVHPRTIKRWESQGLPVHRITRKTVRYALADVERFLSKTRVE